MWAFILKQLLLALLFSNHFKYRYYFIWPTPSLLSDAHVVIRTWVMCVYKFKKKQQQRICFTYALVLTQFFYQKIITYINLEFSISSLSKNINFNCVALKSSHLLLVRYNFLYLLIRNSFQNSSEQFHAKNVKLYFIW